MTEPSEPAAQHSLAFERNATDLLLFFERRVGDNAADVVAETFSTAWRRHQLMPGRRHGRTATDLRDCAQRALLNNARRSHIRRNRLADRLRAQWKPASDEPTDAMMDVRDAIASLSPDQADIVTLIHWDGFNSSEVGSILGLPASTVRSRYAAAKQQLAATLLPMPDRADDQEPFPPGHLADRHI